MRKTYYLTLSLERALKLKQLKKAWPLYMTLRQRVFPPDPHHRWLRLQNMLLRLIHRASFKYSGTSQEMRRTRGQLKVYRKIVLKDMVHRTLKTEPVEMSMLADALARSKGLIQYMWRFGHSGYARDWRKSLAIMEDWALNRKVRMETVALLHTRDSRDSVLSSGRKTRKQVYLERLMSAWLESIYKRLVNSHTHLVRTMIEKHMELFGVPASLSMYMTLLEHYAELKDEKCQDVLDIVQTMNAQNIPWQGEIQVYDYLLYALSHNSGGVSQADEVIRTMLKNKLVPRERTMIAAILCAARSGDMEACSRYISMMHSAWSLSLTQRMKAILLYACSVRGDFEVATEIMMQLSQPSTEPPKEHSAIGKKNRGRRHRQEAQQEQPSVTDIQEVLLHQGIVDTTNYLLALINETQAKRAKMKDLSQEYIKEEVSKVLELFTIITTYPDKVDTQLYTIMMHYLSTLPSPLPGMLHLYKEMLASANAKPNRVTFKIIMDACAEQMDMDKGKALWLDMKKQGIMPDCHIRASYVKGWGRVRNIEMAEAICQEGLNAQRALMRSLHVRSKDVTMSRPQVQVDSMNRAVVHELMMANVLCNRLNRVVELFREMESGLWGSMIKPSQTTISILIKACGSSMADRVLVDAGIELIGQHITMWRQDPIKDAAPSPLDEFVKARDPSLVKDITRLKEHEHYDNQGLSDYNYGLYFVMLGRQHRQEKMMEVWHDMIRHTEYPPSKQTVWYVADSLEDVQWGAGPLKRLFLDLQERWPNINWRSRGRPRQLFDAQGSLRIAFESKGNGSRGFRKDLDIENDEDAAEDVDDDDTTGAGGRFWKS
ncbi:hypothetical protein BGZ94_009313 [Podila epigama]|nr:hypothetical protein BGZ94_009313 [Podila epigama]